MNIIASPLSQRIINIAESATLAMAKKARELRASGVDIISLSLGEPDFATPKHIQLAAKAAIDEGIYFSYPPVAGYQDLKEGICQKFKRDNNLDFTSDQIVVSTGAKQSIANVVLSIIDPGDEIIVFTPYWVSYVAIIQLAEGQPIFLKGALENDFKIGAEQLEQAITSRTKAIIFSSPCNPTGSVYSKEELANLAEVLKYHEQITIISDEIYEYINFEGMHHSLAHHEELRDRTVIVNGFSKGFAMTGWRLGYIAAPKAIAKACEKMQGQITSGTCSIAQRAAVAAITGPIEPCLAMKEAYLKRRALVAALLDDLPGVEANLPQGAFYFFPDVSYYFGRSYGHWTIQNADDLCLYLLEEAGVSLVTGNAFGEPNCIRISYAASEAALEAAFIKLKQALELLN